MELPRYEVLGEQRVVCAFDRIGHDLAGPGCVARRAVAVCSLLGVSMLNGVRGLVKATVANLVIDRYAPIYP